MSEVEKKTAETEHLRQMQVILRKDMNDLSNDVLDGSCRSYEEYRYKTGVIHGLARAERELLDLDTLIVDN